MFKLENYITPLLLSYVDKYIKNFRPEDSQVSLWGGDASFHNLDLRLEVLEQELQLPFSFVSGHIHELLIHVPWTKLASEPITITINTIECILKLRNTEDERNVDSRDRMKRGTNKRQEVEAPPGYVQSLINKIVSNIKIYCNNLILKYVEEDIVVSMNVKLLTFESANEKWEPAYIDISSPQVTLRKLITISDLTICLDKRNAAGKIDVYQEPVLYRCSLIMHMLRQYHSASAKRASTTRLDIYCSSMEFSMTEQQVPMLLRVAMLLYALQQRQLRPELTIGMDIPSVPADIAEILEVSESWAGWAWSFVPSILPLSWDQDWDQEQQRATSGHTVHIGFYVDYASLTFKVSESSSERSIYYSQRKLKYLPVLTLRLQGIFVESVSHGAKWFHCQCGVSQAILLPVGQCTCAHSEIPEGISSAEYLQGGLISMTHKTDSLFDAEAPENKGLNRTYNTSWDFHMLTVTEGSLLERTSAFASDYLYQLEVPDDMSSERLSELGSDLEYSNLHERSLLRIVVGPLRLRMCSGFFHRISSLKVAASAYDYPPYSIPTPDPALSELPPSCAEDFDALSDNIPSRTIQITIIAPAIEMQVFDHPYFVPTKRNLYCKRQKIPTTSSPGIPSSSRTDLPKVTLECQCIDMKFQQPMYIKRLVNTICQLPEPPKQMFDACHVIRTFKLLGLSSHLIISPRRQTTIITPSSASFNSKTILKPQYWVNPDIPHTETTFESESITITGTKAKVMIALCIIKSMVKMDGQDSINSFSNNTLLRDASRTYGMAYLEICIEDLRWKCVTTKSTISIDTNLGSVKAFVYEPVLDTVSLRRSESMSTIGSTYSGMSGRLNTAVREIQQVLIVSGPEIKLGKQNVKRGSVQAEKLPDSPLFTATIQFPLNAEHQTHPPIIIFNIQEIRICIDPLLCRWLLYIPRPTRRKTDFFDAHLRRNRNISEASGSVLETPRRAGTPHESVHSSSDREHAFIPPPIQKLPKDAEPLDILETMYNFLKDWFSVGKCILLNGEISQCTLYFPVESLSAIGSHGIQEAVEEALKKEHPPEIFVVALPLTTAYSASQPQNLSKYMTYLPIKLPQAIWTSSKPGFPWVISVTEMSCYTLQNGQQLHFLKPFSLNATLGMSTKSNNIDNKYSKSNIGKDNISTTVKMMRNNENINAGGISPYSYENTKSDIGSLAICVHIDMTNITISLSQVQVCLIASILYGLTEVMNNLIPMQTKENPKSPEPVQNILGWSSTVSPTLLRESTLDSISEQTPPIATVTENIENDSVKLSIWIQWTIAHFKIQLLSHDSADFLHDDVSYLYSPNLKLVVDAEDIVSSLDLHSHYLKVKSKVACANIQHFKRKKASQLWVPGRFLGLVMKSKDDLSTGERQGDTALVSVIITRASCRHTYALWGTVPKHKIKESKISSGNTLNLHTSSPYITEIVIESQPIDFVISLTTLRAFYMVLDPLMDLPQAESEETKPKNHWLLQVNNQNLPLVYIESHALRLIVPSVELGGTGAEHDVCMFQIDRMNLKPSADNPICRTPCRPDVYQLAAQSRILNIPGSEVEDRQFQLDVTGLCISTLTWDELDPILNISTSYSSLKTMSENPALEWNNLEQGCLSISRQLSFWPVINKFDLCIVIAPAMIYKTNTLVCGHSVEVNCVSDMEINISLSQIQLASALLSELFHILEPFLFYLEVSKRPRIRFPYPKFDPTQLDMEEEESDSVDIAGDSGIETSELQSIFSTKTKESASEPVSQVDVVKRIGIMMESEKTCGIFPRPPNQLPSAHHNIPVDLLLTGGKITLALYQLNRGHGKVYLKQNDRKHKPILKDIDYENGYDASEEGSVDEKHNLNLGIKQFQPLLFILLSQPNAYLSRFYLGRKIQLSCFDVRVKISGPEYVPLKSIPTEEDYPINLLETKSGMPNPDTGIPPAFFMMKWSRGLGKPATVEIEIARPTRILCSVTRWNYLIIIKDKVMDSFNNSFTSSCTNDLQITNVYINETSSNYYPLFAGTHKTAENYIKFREIKNKFYKLSTLNMKLSQIVLIFKTENVPEVNVSISKLKNNLTISNRPERLTNIITLESLTVGMLKDGITRLLLNPWTISVETSLFWESWQSIDSNPQIQISVESDCIVVDISPEQIKCLEVVVKDVTEFISSLSYEDPLIETSSASDCTKSFTLDRDQYYKDDLRAGAFQFVDASSNNADELPLPYQVMFWSGATPAMAWRYPQPRALTKVRVFPVPFKITSNNQNESDYQILCHLEYWSDCHGCYRPYVQFFLSECEVSHLNLPESNIQPVACIWRVVLSIQTDCSHLYDFDCSKIVISPRALAACMRIDSYFNKALVPDLTLVLEISTVNISLHSNFNKSLPIVMPNALKQYTTDLLFPETHCFLSLAFDGIKSYLATWNFDAAAFDITTNIKCTVLDYAFLTQQTFVESFSAKLEVDFGKNTNINAITKPITIKFGPSIAHTLAVGAQIWEQSWKSKGKNEESVNLIIMTRYVVCNNTNINLRFGQVSTEEDILLLPHYCHLYCWRSQKSKQMIRVGVEENGWIWSRPFPIDTEGSEAYQISKENNEVLIVTVKNLSATQKQITFSGQLIICNMLLEHFELKVVLSVKEDKDKEFKKTPSHLIPGKSTPPSLLINTKKKYHLRLRFFGLESAWSGDIPLVENTKCPQPWLVKVPLQERGQFLSIWCRIMTQTLSRGTQTLAILWPLFMVRSNLPVNAKVHIETPTLNVHLESTVHGKGEYQQLYCPGTIDHSHQLSFQLESGSPTSNPYVPLNYSLVDQKQFFKRQENEDINETLQVLSTFDKSPWPYFGEDMNEVEWITEDQPLTHVQVRYQNACQYSSALLVELLPWSLMINILGCPVAIIVNEKELCRLCHHGIITPPKLEGTFHIGVGINGTWNVSLPLQLAKSEWSQVFSMPRITGTIPMEGSIKTAILCNKNLCMVSICSNLVNEIRLLKICSSHILTNYTHIQLQVMCFAVRELEVVSSIPADVEKYSFTIAPGSDKSNSGISVIQWYIVANSEEVDANANFALYISFSMHSKFGWSCPVRVDNILMRRSIVVQTDSQSIPIVIVAQEHKGQMYLSLYNDLHPQILIENKSGIKLFFAQSSNEEVIVQDCQHFKWVCGIENQRACYYSMPGYSEKFPDLSQNSPTEDLVIACDPYGDRHGYQWSQPISIANYREQFLRIPFFGDVKILIVHSIHTTFITIDSASQIEISARDIRVRLFMHENEIRPGGISKLELSDTLEECGTESLDTITPSSSTIHSKYYSAEDITLLSTTATTTSVITPTTEQISFSQASRPGTYGVRTLPVLPEKSVTTFDEPLLKRVVAQESSYSNTVLSYTMPMKKDCCSSKCAGFIKRITLILISDLNSISSESSEIASITCDGIGITAEQSKNFEVNLSISEIQFDNQMHMNGGFDFPVVLIGQEIHPKDELVSLNTPIRHWITNAQSNPLVNCTFSVETWKDPGRNKNISEVRDVVVKIQPISAYIEDVYITKLLDYITIFIPTNLVLWPIYKRKLSYNLNSMVVGIPEQVVWESSTIAYPVTFQSLSIEPLSLLLSVHSSIKLYIALDQSPLQFGQFQRRRVQTTPYRLGHALTMHYLSGAIFGAGWVVGSLELLGSPGGLARAMGSGLRDFVNLPYRGLFQGPWAFLRGVTHGSASLMRHVTAGTLQSVTKLASSVARNLDRLTLDEEHLRRTEEQRRQRPQGLAQGFLQGLTGLGISLLGAVGGIAHHPIQSVMMEGASPRGLAAGVGLGLVGVITKPLSGAADLVALTGEGLLQGAGWNPLPEPRNIPSMHHVFSNSNSTLKYNWKFMQSVTHSTLLFVTEATWVTPDGQYEGVALLLTTDALVIINTDEDTSQRVVSLSELSGADSNADPTLLNLKLNPGMTLLKIQDECVVEMDPACRARVADYVRSTVGLLQHPEDLSPDPSEMSVSPCPTPTTNVGPILEQTALSFYVNPQSRNYFLTVLSLAKQQHQNYSFPIL